MGRPAAPGRSGRGGESIPPVRTLHLRLAAAAAAAALAAGLAIYPVLGAGRLTGVLGLLAAVGVGCTLAAPYTRGHLTGAALFTLAAEYVVAEATGRVPAGSVAAYAAGLILVSELLLWCVQLPRSGRADRAVAGRQLVMLTTVALAAAVLALAALAAAGLQLPGAWTGALLGVTAAVALLALPSVLLRVGGGGRAHEDLPGVSRDDDPAG